MSPAQAQARAGTRVGGRPPMREFALERQRRRIDGVLLAAVSVPAAFAFAWPFAASSVRLDASFAAGVAIAIIGVLVAGALVAVNRSLVTARTIAVLGTLVALGMVLRFLGLGFGGIEPIFALLILAGRAFGARFGFALGALVLLSSALLWGGVGPWLPFQMFAAAWVGAAAAWLPRLGSGAKSGVAGSQRVPGSQGSPGVRESMRANIRRRRAEVVMLAGYGVLASYAYGILLNLSWWPLAVGLDTSVSFDPAVGLGDNMARFVTYSLLTSTLTWDTVRAIVTAGVIFVVGRPVLGAFARVRR